MKSYKLLLAVASACCIHAVQADTIIYADDFSSGTIADTLNGTVPDTRPGTEVWTTSTAVGPDTNPTFGANGHFFGVGLGQSHGAYLPITIEAGKVYAVSLDLAQVWKSSTSWFGMGLATAGSTGSFSSPFARMLMRANGGVQALTTGDTNVDVAAGTYGTSGTMINTIELILNTQNSIWSAEYKVGGSTIGSVKDLSVTPTGQAYLQIVTLSNKAEGTMDNLSVHVIPEPATLGLVAAFGGGVLFIRRLLMM